MNSQADRSPLTSFESNLPCLDDVVVVVQV